MHWGPLWRWDDGDLFGAFREHSQTQGGVKNVCKNICWLIRAAPELPAQNIVQACSFFWVDPG